MPSLDFILGGIIVLFLYLAFARWQKKFAAYFKPTKLPADPPSKPGPSPYETSRGCLFELIRFALVGAFLLWLVWLVRGL